MNASPPSTPAARLWRWLDERTGCDRLLHVLLDEPIPGGARWAYIFGSGLLFLLLSQLVTGILLALYYVPAANDAHISVAYVVKVVSAGSFLRSLHAYGASTLIVVLLLHITQTFLYGSYKGRRELLWLAGCVLLLLVLGMAFTGYLLPWDERAYFATAVGTNVMGEVPLVGNTMKRLLRGGNSMGTVTLSRFFVLHVFVLPLLLAAFVAAHVALFRKAGPAGPAGAEAPARASSERFYPRQLIRDTTFALLLVAVLAALAYWFPVRLGPEANPGDTTFLPRPEWYYLPVFEWLKFWPGRSALIGIVLLPALLAALFAGVPWLDRRIERHPRRRPLAVGLFGAVMIGLIGLGTLSHIQDRRNPLVALQLARQQHQAEVFMRAPFVPLAPPETAAPAAPTTAPAAPTAAPAALPATLTPAQLLAAGAKSYGVRGCAFCHGDDGEGSDQAPSLQVRVPKLNDAQLSAFLQHPSDLATRTGMPSFDGSPEELKALIAYLRSLSKTQ